MTKREMIIDVLEHRNWGSERRFENIVNRTIKAKTKEQIEKIYNYHLAHTEENDYIFCAQLLLS